MPESVTGAALAVSHSGPAHHLSKRLVFELPLEMLSLVSDEGQDICHLSQRRLRHHVAGKYLWRGMYTSCWVYKRVTTAWQVWRGDPVKVSSIVLFESVGEQGHRTLGCC